MASVVSRKIVTIQTSNASHALGRSTLSPTTWLTKRTMMRRGQVYKHPWVTWRTCWKTRRSFSWRWPLKSSFCGGNGVLQLWPTTRFSAPPLNGKNCIKLSDPKSNYCDLYAFCTLAGESTIKNQEDHHPGMASALFSRVVSCPSGCVCGS